MKTIIFLFAVITCVLSASPSWNDLRTTFGINPFSKWDFAEMPRDLSQDTKGFTLKDNMCSGSQQFVGSRYWSDSDPALILLFDVNGYIAGIQTSVAKSTGYNPGSPMIGTWFIDEGDYLTLTVYFVDPSIVCTTGRSAADFQSEGTGTDLYLQNGPNPLTNYYKVPTSESEIKATLWGSGKCFYEMGMHYWFNITSDMSCDNFVPYCLLYNGGVLNAFCFAMNFDVTGSERYEHPTPLAAASCCMDPVPKCISGKQSTMHVYETSNYLANRC